MRQGLSRRTFLKLAGYAPLSMTLPRLAPPAVGASTFARTWKTTGHVVPELARFDTTLQNFMQARNIPGGALAVTRNSKLVLARGYTWRAHADDLIVQPTSLFRIASITKPFTSVAVLRLVQDNKLNLNTSVTSVLNIAPPPGQSPDRRLGQVTVKRLLQHLGGWDRDLGFDPMFYDPTIASALGMPLPITKHHIATYMAGQPLQHTPGTIFAYSNYGYSLLGKIVEAVSKQTYYNYIVENILIPLNITRVRLGRSLETHRLANEVKYHSQFQDPTVFNSSGALVPNPYGAWNLENMDAHGGLLASAVDLVKFAAAFDDPSSSPVLNQASINLMFGLPENMPSSSYTPGDSYYSCGWSVRDWRNGHRNTWHGGSLPGTSTLLVRRGDGLNWCVLFNQRDDPSRLSYGDIDGLLHSAADAVTKWPAHDLFPEHLPRASVSYPFIFRIVYRD